MFTIINHLNNDPDEVFYPSPTQDTMQEAVPIIQGTVPQSPTSSTEYWGVYASTYNLNISEKVEFINRMCLIIADKRGSYYQDEFSGRQIIIFAV